MDGLTPKSVLHLSFMRTPEIFRKVPPKMRESFINFRFILSFAWKFLNSSLWFENQINCYISYFNRIHPFSIYGSQKCDKFHCFPMRRKSYEKLNLTNFNLLKMKSYMSRFFLFESQIIKKSWERLRT